MNEPNRADASVRQRVEFVMIGGQNRRAKLLAQRHRETIGQRNSPVNRLERSDRLPKLRANFGVLDDPHPRQVLHRPERVFRPARPVEIVEHFTQVQYVGDALSIRVQ